MSKIPPPIFVPSDATPEADQVSAFILGLWNHHQSASFQAKLGQAAEDLEQYGVAVVPGMLSHEECSKTFDDFWAALELGSSRRLVRPHSAEDLTAFRFGAAGWPMNKHGIFEQGGFAHLPFIYQLRSGNPAMTALFSALYGCQAHQLVVSPDRLNFQLPTEWLPLKGSHYSGAPPIKLQQEHASWLHVDQAVTKPGRHCIQGLLTYTPATHAGDASFECTVGSHLVHQHLERILGRKLTSAQRRADWLMFSAEDKQRLADIVEFDEITASSDSSYPTLYLRKNIPYFAKFESTVAEAGSAILWDSRLAHQGGAIRASPSQPRDDPSNPRLVGYYCAQPWWAGADALPLKEYEKKVKLFEKRSSAAHWPLKTKIFGQPRTYGKALPQFDWDKICAPTPEPRTLAAQFFGLGRAHTEHSGILCFLQNQLPPASKPLLEFHPTSGGRHPDYNYEAGKEEKSAHEEAFWPRMRLSINETLLGKRNEEKAAEEKNKEDEEEEEEDDQSSSEEEVVPPKKKARKD
jgi:hypothetical protein